MRSCNSNEINDLQTDTDSHYQLGAPVIYMTRWAKCLILLEKKHAFFDETRSGFGMIFAEPLHHPQVFSNN